MVKTMVKTVLEFAKNRAANAREFPWACWPTKVDEDAPWRGLSVCSADTLAGALRPEEVRVEMSLHPAGKSACATSASRRINDLEKRLQRIICFDKANYLS